MEIIHLFTYWTYKLMFRRQGCGLPAIRGVRAATFKRRSNFLKWWRFGASKPAMAAMV